MELIAKMFQGTGHPTTDFIVGVPLSVLVVWAVQMLYKTSTQVREISTILFGRPGVPGKLKVMDDDIESLRREVDSVKIGRK